jgi:RimJ/RimL family protein N-acetyltransferase
MYSCFLKDHSATRRVIGVVGARYGDRIHYSLHPDFWNAGYITEALRAFLPVLFQKQPGRQFVYATVLAENLQSQRVLEKCGFIPKISKQKDAKIDVELEQAKLDELRDVIKSLGLVQSSALPVKPAASSRKLLTYRYDRPLVG